ncbi:hypothetical protein ONS95_012580 [Cadophora gregata]|uniref:uncharacterized protein n=1 Tax=Cadophora gregata TaxID=51156 RepID=UPI0026DB80F9|nr:uncharacterized protein ONS95_012580 [Cadophora gregata]KAK0118283.1 hypothetical protein ONS95_012580 [Cadophora gregata]
MARTLSSSGESGAAALRGQTPSPSPRTASTSLQAAAAVNAGLQQEDSRRLGSSSGSITRNRQPSHAGRRRSTVLMNLQLNDPSLPAPGEMVHEPHVSGYRTSSPHSLTGSPIISSGDPHHFRAPSLGEIHQEIEQEQEAQVNRLLQMIRTQQQELQQLQLARGADPSHSTPPVIDESTPTSERSMSFSNQNPRHSTMSTPRSPSAALHPRSSFDLARADLQHRRSRTPSRTASPRLRSTSISGEGGETWNLGGRDESAFYQAETQMMIRENQMLRQRIRELERQVSELHTNSAITNEPATPSHLLRSQSVSEEAPPEISAATSTAPAPTSANPTAAEEVKND